MVQKGHAEIGVLHDDRTGGESTSSRQVSRRTRGGRSVDPGTGRSLTPTRRYRRTCPQGTGQTGRPTPLGGPCDPARPRSTERSFYVVSTEVNVRHPGLGDVDGPSHPFMRGEQGEVTTVPLWRVGSVPVGLGPTETSFRGEKLERQSVSCTSGYSPLTRVHL